LKKYKLALESKEKSTAPFILAPSFWNAIIGLLLSSGKI
jgi:hypothetical protein